MFLNKCYHSIGSLRILGGKTSYPFNALASYYDRGNVVVEIKYEACNVVFGKYARAEFPPSFNDLLSVICKKDLV